MNFRLLSFLFLCSAGLNAQNANIEGVFTLLPGREVRLISVSDPFSKTEEILDIDSVDTDGKFDLDATLEEYQQLFISVNRYKAPVFLGPGDSLILEFSSKPKYRLADSWLKGNLEYTFVDSDDERVNKEISRFDGAYYLFFIQNAPFIGTSKIKSKIANFESEFAAPDTAHPFVQFYVHYSVAEMKLSNGFNREKIYKEYLEKEELHPSHPAWISFFNSFFADYFNEHDNRFGGAALYNQLNDGISIDSLQTLLERDPYLGRPKIRQLVLLKSISEAYGNSKYQKAPLKKILNSICQNPESEKIETFARHLQNKWDKLEEKKELTYIRDTYAKNLKAYSDSVPTLLITSLSGGPQLLKEIAVIEDLLARYPELFRVVELHIGVNASSRSRNWPMVMIDKNYEYLSEFQIYSIPHFMWFDASNTLQLNPATAPSEGLEELLYKLKAEKDRENKIKIGK